MALSYIRIHVTILIINFDELVINQYKKKIKFSENIWLDSNFKIVTPNFR